MGTTGSVDAALNPGWSGPARGRRRRGFALVVVLLIGFIASAVAATILATTMATAVSTGHSGAAEQARSLALYGIERANAYVFPFEKLSGDYDGLLDPGLVGSSTVGAGLADCTKSPPVCAASGGKECNLPLYTDPTATAITYAGKRYMRVAVGGGAYLTRFDDDSDDLIDDNDCTDRSCLNDLWREQTGNSCTSTNKCREGPSTTASKNTCGASAFDNPFRDRNRAVVATVIGIWPGTNPATAAHRVVYRQTFTMQAPPTVYGIESEKDLKVSSGSKLFMCSPIASVGVYGKVDVSATSGCYCGPARGDANSSTQLKQCDINEVIESTCQTLSECVFGEFQEEPHLRAEPDADCTEQEIADGSRDDCRVEQVMIPRAPRDTASPPAYRLREHGLTAIHASASDPPESSGAQRTEFAFDLSSPCNFWVGTRQGGNLPPWDRGTVTSVTGDVLELNSPRTWASGAIGVGGNATPLRVRILDGSAAGQSRRIANITPKLIIEKWNLTAPGSPRLVGNVNFNAIGAPDSSGLNDTFFTNVAIENKHEVHRVRGKIFIPNSGVWTFRTTSDDGSILRINGATIVDNDGVHGDVQRSCGTSGQSACPTLTSGFHDIELLFFNTLGFGSVDVSWVGPGVTEATIPAANLFHAPATGTFFKLDSAIPGLTAGSAYEIYSDPADAALSNSIHLATYFWDANATLASGATCKSIVAQSPKAALPVPGTDAGFEACWVPIMVGRNRPTEAPKHSNGTNATGTFTRNLVCGADSWASPGEVGADCRWKPKWGDTRTLNPTAFRAAEGVVGLPSRLTGTSYALPDWGQCAITYPKQNLLGGAPQPISCSTTGHTHGQCDGNTVAMSWDPHHETYFFTDAILCPGGVCPAGSDGPLSSGFKPKKRSRTVGAVVVGSYYFGNNLFVGQPHTFGGAWPVNLAKNSKGTVRTNFDLRRFPRATIVVDGNLEISPGGAGDFWFGPGIRTGSWPSRANLSDAERRRASSRFPSIIAGGRVTLGPRVRRVAGTIWAGDTFEWKSNPWVESWNGTTFIGDSIVLDGELHGRGNVSFTGTGRFYWNYRNLLKSEDDGSLAELDYVTPPLRSPSGE